MIRKAYVDTEQGQVHYRKAGRENGPPVLFFHQNTSSSAMFDPVLLKMQNRYQVIAIDLPGFGGTYDPPERFDDISYLTNAMMQAVDNLGIQAFHVCGQHTGASIAVEMGARFPERVKSVITIGPLYLTDEKNARYKKAFNGSVPPDLAGEYLGNTWNTLCQGGANATLPLMHREMWEGLRSWQARGWVYQCVWDHDFKGYFDQLKCPVLLLASKGDVLYPGLEYAKSCHPEVDAVVTGGSNFEPELDPDGVSGAIAEFLQKHGWE